MRALVLFLCFFPYSVFASGYPVFDPLNWIQNQLTATETFLTEVNTRINNQMMIVTIRQRIQQLQQMERQWKQIQRQYEALSGKNGYGQWLNGPARLLDPNYKPEDIDDWINIMSSGRTGRKIGGSSDQDWKGEKFPNNYSTLPRGEAYPRNSNSRRARQEEEHSYKTGAAHMTSRQIYKSIKKRHDRIEALQEKAEDAETMKQALDINNLIVAELNTTLVEVLHLHSALAQMQSSHHQGKVNQERSDALFNRF